jgi:hypothetical protein
MTPEGKVKDAVKKLLKSRGEELDQFWPVQNGMGTPALDCVVCYRGYHCEIETKAPGKHPTPRQEQTIIKITKAGSPVFVIDSDTCAGFVALKQWLDVVAILPIYRFTYK